MAYDGTPATEYLGTDIVQQHIAQATTWVAEEIAARFSSSTVNCIRGLPSLRFDSPLEVIFWVWWNALEFSMADTSFEPVALMQQQEVRVDGERYRVDFLVEPSDAEIAAHPMWKPIAVEVDGHAFHEKTPEQVVRRNQRDRALQQAGWRVFHFSFAEFTSNPVGCVREVMAFAFKQWQSASIDAAISAHKASGFIPNGTDS